MSTETPFPIAFDPAKAAESFARVAEQSQRLIADFMSRQQSPGGLGMADPADVGKVFAELTQRMMTDPLALATATFDLWNAQMKAWQHASQRLIGQAEASELGRRDRRFRHPEWSENAVFEYLKQSYLLSADAILAAVRKVEGL